MPAPASRSLGRPKAEDQRVVERRFTDVTTTATAEWRARVAQRAEAALSVIETAKSSVDAIVKRR
jgi:hypothetical protein